MAYYKEGLSYQLGSIFTLNNNFFLLGYEQQIFIDSFHNPNIQAKRLRNVNSSFAKVHYKYISIWETWICKITSL